VEVLVAATPTGTITHGLAIKRPWSAGPDGSETPAAKGIARIVRL